MTIKPKSHIEIALESIKVFLNDGTLDLSELNVLLGLALRDQQIDEDEKRVLKNVFKQAEKSTLAPAVQARIDEVRLKHGLAD